MHLKRHRLLATLVFFSFALAAFLTPWSGPARAAEQSKVMLVLDASGSMWGQIEGTSKIVIARRAVRELLAKWNKDIQLGLSAYGHRKKGDCGDIQTIYPVGPTRPDVIVDAVNALKPKGKTPLSEAVRRAAQELKFTENKASVILISDGRETCKADPCALGRELSELGVDFKVHVVGFDVARSEQEGLRCLAENTGGLFLAARDAAELNEALARASTAVKAEAEQPVAQKPKSKPAPAPPKKAEKPGHRFSAVLSEGDDPISQGMRWDVYAATEDAQGKRKRFTGTYNAEPTFVLDPGAYRVVAKYGNATVSEEFEVASASEVKSHELVLNAGLLALSASFEEGGETIVKGMRWDVYAPKQNIDGKRQRINGTYDSTPLFKLSAGTYVVVAKTGNATASGEVEVKAGERTERTFVMGAGLAAFSARYAEGGTEITRGMRWDVYEPEKNLEGKRKRINGTYDANPVFRLPGGRYHVVARRGNATVTREIEVAAGKRSEFAFVMNAGLLALSAVLTEDGEPLKKMRWDVYESEKNLEGKRARINGTYDTTPVFALPAGKYHVVARSGNAVKTADVEVNADKRTDFRFDLAAGQVKLVAVGKDGGQVEKGLRWDVYAAEANLEGKRQRINGTYDASPVFTLNAGDYLVVLKLGQAKVEQKLTVKPGDSRQVDVSLK